MTNMADCIARAMALGRVDKTRGEEALREFDELVKRYETIMTPESARVQAAEALREATKQKVAARRHKVLVQLTAMKRIKHLVENARDPSLAVKALLEYNPMAGMTGENVRSMREALEDRIRMDLHEMLEKVGMNMTGSSRDAALLEKIILEGHGDDTGDAVAKAFAQSVERSREGLRIMFNDLGGNIGKLSNYGVPHTHDAGRMLAAGKQSWKDFVYERAAWDRIIDLSTGEPFVPAPGEKPQRIYTEKMLDEMFDGITMKGANTLEPSMAVGGKALYAQRAEHRVLHFRDGAAWIEYNKEFGASDPFTAMMDGLSGMARDVALMRVLGPNPRMGLEFAAQVAQRRAADLKDPKLLVKVNKQNAVAKTIFSAYYGEGSRAVSEGWAKFFSGVRSYLVANQLGSAVLSTWTDLGTITLGAHHMGMNASNVLGRSVKLMASHATRTEAARMGYSAHTLMESSSAATRHFGKLIGNGVMERLAGFTIRSSGLSFVTDMRRIAFHEAFSGHMAEHANLPYDHLPDGLLNLFKGRGITARDWDVLRDPEARFVNAEGGDFIAPLYWLETQTTLPRTEAEGLALRLQAVMNEQLEFVLPTGSHEATARIRANTQPGTFAGELLRSGGMYKGFAVSFTINQYRRFMELDGLKSRAEYLAKLAVLPALLGALSIQNKEISKGNDPRPMDEKFWAAAIMQGGGLGIFGDFFASTENRLGGGFAETLSGPVVGLANDIARTIVPNVNAAVMGEETHFGRDAARFIGRNTPVLSSHVATRAAFARLVMDNVSQFLDPEAEINERRRYKRMLKDYGTSPFMTSDSIRLPDLGNAFGQTP